MTEDGNAERLASGSTARRLAGSALAAASTDRLAAAYFLSLGVAAFLPTLGGGYLLQLDMVFAPDASHLQFALDSKGPLYYGRLPFVALLDAVAVVVPDWVVQRVILVGAIAGAGYAAYAATDGQQPAARLFAGTLYAVNPFVYVRLLAGQWYVALGYAVLPLAVVSFHAYVTGERPSPKRAVGWATMVAVFDPHVAVLLAMAGGVILVPVAIEVGRDALFRTGRFAGIAVGVNAYWLLPAVVALVGGDSQLATVTGADLVAFSPRGSVAGNVPLSVTMLYGFWRGGYTYPFDLLPLWVVVGLFAFLLGFAVYGWLTSDDALTDGLLLTTIVGGVLSMGVTTDLSEPLFRIISATPIGAGMREAGKFIALVALGYALLGARGVTQVHDDLDVALAARSPGEGAWRLTQHQLRQGATLVLVVAVVVLPLAYTFPMVAGFWGGFEPTSYPADWHAADDRLEADDGDYRVLYLPWHQYLVYEWAGGTVATPASLFFDTPVVHSRDPNLGIGSPATDPTHRQMRAVLGAPDAEQFGARVAPLGVKYVVLSKTADYRRYAFLREQADLTVVSEGDHLVVFENEAFEPTTDSWPAAGPRIPSGSLFAGGLLSMVTLVAQAARRDSVDRP